MNREQARALIVEAVGAVAPDVDVAAIDPAGELTVEADLDSIDFLTLVTRVSQAIGSDIPERDYPRVLTLDAFTDYLVAGG